MTTATDPGVTLRDLEAQGVETVSVPTAAKLLGVGRNQAYDACRVGQIPSLKIGARVLVPVAGLRRLLEGAVEGNGGAA